MKFTISQKILCHAIERGSIVALSEDAQSDTSYQSLLNKSIKISVNDKNLTIESATQLMSVQYSVPVSDLDVQETGSIMIPAKEFYQWVLKQGDSSICIAFVKSDKTEFIMSSSDSSDSLKNAVKKIGVAKFVSRDSSKTGNKWSLDCYDSTDSNVNVSVNKPELSFIVDGQQFIDSIKYTSFSAMSKHYEHIYDGLILDVYDRKLHIAGCDTTRCAIYCLDTAININDELLHNNYRILIPCDFTKIISKLFDVNSQISFFYDINKNKIFIEQRGLQFKLTTADKDLVKKFPPISILLKKRYNEFCEIDKQILQSRLSTASMVNKNSALFKFNHPESTVTIKTISESGLSPCICISPALNLKESRRIVWAINHLLDIIKIIKDDSIIFYMPLNNDKGQDNNSYKILSNIDKNMSYYCMSVNNSKYDVNEA